MEKAAITSGLASQTVVFCFNLAHALCLHLKLLFGPGWASIKEVLKF
jgi:hypothetical protein